MLSGDNGILTKATQSKEWTERAEIVETAQMDILGKQAQNHGSLSEQELIDILTSNDYNTKGTLSDNNEESVLQKTLTSNNGKYQIPVSEIYNGSLIGKSSDENTTYSDDVKTKLALNLQEEIPELRSPYVQYNGKLYKVLYNDDVNGIELIAMTCEGTYQMRIL